MRDRFSSMRRLPVRFGLRQTIGVMTAVAAGIVIMRYLFDPPLGSTGLREALVAGIAIVVACWYCGRSTASRLLICGMTSAVFTIYFSWMWLSHYDFIFHTKRYPPQFIIAACVAGGFGILANAAWYIHRLLRRGKRDASSTRPESQRRGRLAAYCVFSVAIVSAVLTAISATQIPYAMSQLDFYVESRIMAGPNSILQMAEQLQQRELPYRHEMASRMVGLMVQPGDAAALPFVVKLLDDDDKVIRGLATCTLVKLSQIRPSDGGLHGQQVRFSPHEMEALIHGLNSDYHAAPKCVCQLITESNLIAPESYVDLPESFVPELEKAAISYSPEVRAVAEIVRAAMKKSP
jgi:hypothetical protein